jgi:ABC-type dipeptide/oligopeptide/nickel transport system permease subunit
MATIAERTQTNIAGESWELPKAKPWYAKLGQLARENPVGAVAFLIVLAFVALGLFGPYVSPYDPLEVNAAERHLSPSGAHIFGTTMFGRDVFSRVLAGARIDLKFGAIVLVFGFVPGTALGIISGYFGRWVDYLIQRSGEAWTAFPQLFLLLTFVAAFGPGLRTVEIVAAIGALFGGSRLMRVVALVEKQKEYVIGARSTGASEFRLLWRHVLPNIMPFILVGLSSVFALAVLAEATLSFLGLGVSPGEPSWGADLNDGVPVGSTYPWLVIFPGVAISLVVLAFNLLGDTLRDILDPRLRGSTGAKR